MAIRMLNEEQKQHRQAILDNRAAIDYLLLLHHKGCHERKNMCCFNLSDNSNSISKELVYLKNIIKKVQ